MNKVKWLAVVVAVQVIFLLSWAAYHEVIRQNSPVILLKTRPVDPRDLLRGDFMILSYDINEVPAPTDKDPVAGPDDSGKWWGGKMLWVVLQPEGKYYRVVSSSHGKPGPLAPAQVMVKATIERPLASGGWSVKYGIERYFVPEGKGTPNRNNLEVEASVSLTHRLYIRQVFIDGVKYP